MPKIAAKSYPALAPDVSQVVEVYTPLADDCQHAGCGCCIVLLVFAVLARDRSERHGEGRAGRCAQKATMEDLVLPEVRATQTPKYTVPLVTDLVTPEVRATQAPVQVGGLHKTLERNGCRR